MDRSSRRGFLGGLLTVPTAFLGAKALGAARGLGRVVRPAALGTSSGRCGLCGSAGHAMLRCPDAPTVA